jgi:hypothetical protein
MSSILARSYSSTNAFTNALPTPYLLLLLLLRLTRKNCRG